METGRGDRCDGSSLTSYHEVGLQPSRSSHRRVFQPITLTPRMALADLPFNLVDPGGWSNEARSCPIGHVCRLWYHCGKLSRTMYIWEALRRPYLVRCLGPVTGAVETLRELREKPQGGRKTLDIPTHELWGSATHPDPAP